MALINCPECGHMISDKAKSCPHCGYELSTIVKPTRKKSYIIILTTILVMAIGLGVWLLCDNQMECSTESGGYQEGQKTEPTNQINVIGIFDLIKTEDIPWCGIVQKSPVLLSDDEIIDNLKKLGFSIVNQDNQTFEGEGGDLYSAMITNLEYKNIADYKVGVGDGTLSITFPYKEQTDSFIRDAINNTSVIF